MTDQVAWRSINSAPRHLLGGGSERICRNPIRSVTNHPAEAQAMTRRAPAGLQPISIPARYDKGEVLFRTEVGARPRADLSSPSNLDLAS